MSKSFILALIANLFLSVLVMSYFFNRGFTLHDEGYLLNSALRTLHGQVIYRDFDFVYTPISVYLGAVGLSVFGESIMSERLMMLIIAVGTSCTIFLLVWKSTKALFLSLLASFIYLAWGSSHINYLSPTNVGIFFATLTILLLHQKKDERLLLLAGMSGVCTFLSKQNIGIGILLVALIYTYIVKGRKSAIILTGSILGTLFIYTLYLLATHSLGGFITSIQTYSLENIVQKGILDTPFFYGNTIFEKVGKFLLYSFPFFLSLLSLIGLWYTKSRKLLLLPILAIIVYICTIRPTTDYVHLVTTIALVGLAFAALYETVNSHISRYIILAIMTVLIVIGFYTAIFKGYYRWEFALRFDTHYMSNPRVKLWVDAKYNDLLPKLISYFDKNTSPKDKIFVSNFQPMIYFLANRENGTRFDYVTLNVLTPSQEKVLLQELERSHVNYIVGAAPLFDDDQSLLAQYMRNHFNLVSTIDQNFYMWHRK
jgi:hypothetical protein